MSASSTATAMPLRRASPTARATASIVGKFGFMLNNMLGEEDLAGGARRLAARHAPLLDDGADRHPAVRRHGDCARHRRIEPHPHRHPAGRRQSARPWHGPGRLRSRRRGCMSSGTARRASSRAFPSRSSALCLRSASRAHAWPQQNLFFGGVHAARRAPMAASKVQAILAAKAPRLSCDCFPRNRFGSGLMRAPLPLFPFPRDASKQDPSQRGS